MSTREKIRLIARAPLSRLHIIPKFSIFRYQFQIYHVTLPDVKGDFNPLYSGNSETSIFANSEDPDEMQHRGRGSFFWLTFGRNGIRRFLLICSTDLPCTINVTLTS